MSLIFAMLDVTYLSGDVIVTAGKRLGQGLIDARTSGRLDESEPHDGEHWAERADCKSCPFFKFSGGNFFQSRLTS